MGRTERGGKARWENPVGEEEQEEEEERHHLTQMKNPDFDKPSSAWIHIEKGIFEAVVSVCVCVDTPPLFVSCQGFG